MTRGAFGGGYRESDRWATFARFGLSHRHYYTATVRSPPKATLQMSGVPPACHHRLYGTRSRCIAKGKRRARVRTKSSPLSVACDSPTASQRPLRSRDSLPACLQLITAPLAFGHVAAALDARDPRPVLDFGLIRIVCPVRANLLKRRGFGAA